MRRWPRSAAALEVIVNRRGQELRSVPYEQLIRLDEPTSNLVVEGKKLTISIIVEPLPDEVRVVIQGFVEAFIGEHVALDSFYKSVSGEVRPMPDKEFHRYD
jgi:hypothetical protein